MSPPVGEDEPQPQTRAGTAAVDDRDRPMRAGERVMMLDNKDRRYLVTLEAGGEFHTHAGPVSHDDVIGQSEGVAVRSSRGGSYLAVRPTLAELILKMPRGAQVIYPKDLGPILMLADVFPGARVLEAGVGSGALSMTLLRAGADVVGYELREDFANRARANVVSFLGSAGGLPGWPGPAGGLPSRPGPAGGSAGGLPGRPGPDVLSRYRVEIRDVYDGIDEQGLDRMVLDLPEPWRVLKHAETALRPGAILVAYLPTIGQVAQLREAMEDSGFGMAESIEVLHRSWHVDGPSVRPDHRMVAHTGFLTAARLLSSKRSAQPLAPYAQARRDQRRRASWPQRSEPDGLALDGDEAPDGPDEAEVPNGPDVSAGSDGPAGPDGAAGSGGATGARGAEEP